MAADTIPPSPPARYSRTTPLEAEPIEAPLFDVVVITMSETVSTEQAEALQSLFQRLLPKFYGLDYGEVVIHVAAGKPLRILRTDSEVIK